MRIKEVIKDKGMTVSSLAEKMGIKQESLSRAINGNPTLETIDKIACHSWSRSMGAFHRIPRRK